MVGKYFFGALAIAILVVSAAVTSVAQVGELRGTVMMQQADGQKVPLADAQIDVFRTDIKGEYKTKTNKKGEFVFAGGVQRHVAPRRQRRRDLARERQLGRPRHFSLRSRVGMVGRVEGAPRLLGRGRPDRHRSRRARAHLPRREGVAEVLRGLPAARG